MRQRAHAHGLQLGFLLLAAATVTAPSTAASARSYGWLEVGAPGYAQQGTEDDVQAYWAGGLREVDQGGSASILAWQNDVLMPPSSADDDGDFGGFTVTGAMGSAETYRVYLNRQSDGSNVGLAGTRGRGRFDRDLNAGMGTGWVCDGDASRPSSHVFRYCTDTDNQTTTGDRVGEVFRAPAEDAHVWHLWRWVQVSLTAYWEWAGVWYDANRDVTYEISLVRRPTDPSEAADWLNTLGPREPRTRPRRYWPSRTISSPCG